MPPEDLFYYSYLSRLGVEEWVDLPDAVGYYQVSNLGRVKSLARTITRKPGGRFGSVQQPLPERIMSPCTVYRYPTIRICIKNSQTQREVHHFIALAFLGVRQDGLQTCHNDGDPHNNRIYNLRYATPTENTADKSRHGTLLYGSKSGSAKLSESHVLDIRARSVAGETGRSLAKAFNVSPSLICMILGRKVWKHI